MSKFKVGDKVVVCGGDIKTIARVDKWRDGEYGYYFNIDDELLNYQRECDLELYKSPHERLLELGWKQTIDSYEIVRYSLTLNTFTYDITFFKDKKPYFIGTDGYPVRFNLELAEVLVDYLKELEND